MDGRSREVRSLVQRLSSISEQTQMESLCQLRLLSKHDSSSRPLIAESSDALPILTETLYSSSPVAQENAVATLLNLSISNPDALMSTRGLLDALSYLLRLSTATQPSLQIASATLYSLLTVDSFRPIIGSKRDIIFALIDIIRIKDINTGRGRDPRSIKDALKALFGISLYPLNRPTLVDLGVVPPLFTLVVKDGRIGIVEDSTAVIAQVAGCYESSDAFRKASGIGVLVDLLDPSTGSTMRAKENAVSALLNLIQSASGGAEDEHQLQYQYDDEQKEEEGGDFSNYYYHHRRQKSITEDVRDKGLMVLLDGIKDVEQNGTSSKAKTKATALFNILDIPPTTTTSASFPQS